jgi:hypothetical protein
MTTPPTEDREEVQEELDTELLVKQMLIDICVDTTMAIGELLGLPIDAEETMKAVTLDNVEDIANQILSSFTPKEIKMDEPLTYRLFKTIMAQEETNRLFKILKPMRNILVGFRNGLELVADDSGFYLRKPDGSVEPETTV